MSLRRSRLGVRAQLTLIVLLSAILSTAATLFIADNAIQNYALRQAQGQERDNLKIARLVLTTQYGQNISISSDNHLVVDSPTAGKDFNLAQSTNYGKYQLNNDTDYVDAVKQLIGGEVSVFQCADARGSFTQCMRVATTLPKPGALSDSIAQRDIGIPLDATIDRNMALGSSSAHEWLGQQSLDGTQYFVDYSPLFSPQQDLIGVISVGVPLDTVTSFQRSTTIELVLLGVIIMIAGVILALLFASAIVNTLQRAARQVSDASERIGGIAAQQAGGSAQQVWAVNAINKALQNFSEMARDISQRTEQLALMGTQVIQRRAEIAPAQIDQILAYMTRSVRDISAASRQQSAQYERMTGAMQAVIEIAEQVAGNSQQSTESAERLELVVRQLQQLVGVQRLGGRTRSETTTLEDMPLLDPAAGQIAPAAAGVGQPTVRAVRPGGVAPGGTPRGPAGGPMPAMPAMPVMPGGKSGMLQRGNGPQGNGMRGNGAWTNGGNGGTMGGPDFGVQMPPMPAMPRVPGLADHLSPGAVHMPMDDASRRGQQPGSMTGQGGSSTFGSGFGSASQQGPISRKLSQSNYGSQPQYPWTRGDE